MDKRQESERRQGGDRRSGIDRRKNQLEFTGDERRGVAERRHAARRVLLDRRQAI
jgi:hypothetical protein